MKKLFQTLVVAVAIMGLVGVSGCNKELSATYDMPDYEYCIPAQQFESSTGLVQYFPLDKTIILKACSGNHIDKAVLGRITLKTSEAKNTLGSIAKGVQGYVVNSHTSALTSDNMIASTNVDIPAGVTEVELSSSGIDIKEFLTSSDSAYLVLKVWNINNSPAACVKLSKGAIDFKLRK